MLRTPRRSLRLFAFAVAAAIATGACDGGDPTPRPSPSRATGPSASPSGAQRSGPPFDPAAVAIDLEVVAEVPGRPVGAVAAGDGSNRLFVLDQDGLIWLIRDGQLAEAAFFDNAGQTSSGGEEGLLGLAFHPDYPADPRFFVYYTDLSANQVVAAYRVSGDADKADMNSGQILLTMEDFAANHNGGSLIFGQDGFLHVATGDGGGGGDPRGSGQSLNTYLGKILRVDVDAPPSGRPYGIPPDNPFVDRNGALPEIWLTGLRNPWRTSFDRATGDFWIGDVGQGDWEEIDVARAGTSGQNFGWNITEGFHCFRAESCATDGFTGPVTEYGHEFGCAVTGGYVYRGTAVPGLVGGYLFADYCSGIVWVIDAAAAEVREPRIVLESGRSISSFGEDEAGELYATDIGGSLLRVIGR